MIIIINILGKINIFSEKCSESNSRWKPYYDQHSVGHISKTKINSISFSKVYVKQYIFLINRSQELSHTLITELPRTRSHNIPRYRFSFYSLWVIDLKPMYHNKKAKCWWACKKKLFNRPFAGLRHFTTTTRILFVFLFIFKFGSPSEV